MTQRTGRRRFRFGRVAIGLAAFALLVIGYAFAQARRDPVVRRATISLPGWRMADAPMRVVLLSDIHIGGPAMDTGRLARIVTQINALRPDLVVIAGDFISGEDPDAGARAALRLRAPLSGLRARHGAVAVLGNHDHWTAPATVRAQLAGAGVTVLANEVVTRGPLSVGGVDDPFTGRARTRDTLALMRRPALVLAHSPDIAPETPPGTLLLAGHTHCGQIVLPVIGMALVTLTSPDRPLFNPAYRCGLIRREGRTVIVTAGLGASLPLRLGAPPDLWLLTLGP